MSLKDSPVNYALVHYPEFQKTMELLRAYLEGLKLSYEILTIENDLSKEDLEQFDEQILAIETIYDNFKYCLDNPFEGTDSDEKLN